MKLFRILCALIGGLLFGGHLAAQVNIVRAEYFIDIDPGFGLGTAIAITPAASLSDISTSVSLTGVDAGFHNLYLRTLDANGSWSISSKLSFFKIESGSLDLANVVRAEYFFDNDPGFGLGISLPLSPGASLSDISASLPLNTLAPGFHNLFLRTLDANGNWSITSKLPFFKIESTALSLANIVRAEYFFDVEPGFGSGLSIPITPGTSLTDISTSVGLNGLGAGFHNLYLRTLDANGNWSITSTMPFFKVESNTLSRPNIVGAEFFFDTDPGFGQGSSIPVSPGTELNDISTAVPLSGVSAGFHNLYLRTLDANGNWSITSTMPFFKVEANTLSRPNVIRAEYFIDTDPGFGQGSSIPVSQGTDLNDISTAVPLSGVSAGFHNLYLRTLDDNGNWGITSKLSFFKVESASSNLPDIVRAEYFIDTDPGFGLAKPIAITPATAINNLSFEADLTGVTAGFHRFFLRSMDAEGKWSITNTDTFTISAVVIPTVTIGNLVTVACAGSNYSVPFTVNTRFGSTNTFTAQLSDASGNFGSPVNIGSLSSDTSGTIACTIPAAAASGIGYRIRIVSTSPISTSRTSADQLSIKRTPAAGFSISGPAVTCTVQQNYTLSGTESGTNYSWQLVNALGILSSGPQSAIVNWSVAGTDSILVTPANSCGIGTPIKYAVRVFSAPPTFAPTITVNLRTLSAPLLGPDQGVTEYRWYRNGQLISGQTARTYTVPDNETGSYSVAFHNPCGTGVPSDTVLISIVRLNQTITFTPVAPLTFGDGPFNVTATASSGLPLTYSIISGPGTISGNTITITGGGIIVVAAQQAGNDNYNPAVATLSIVINTAPATITLSELEFTYDGTPKRATAVTNPAGLAVAFTYNGSSAQPVNAGSYAVRAAIVNNNYGGTRDSTLIINKAAQSVTIQIIPDKSFNDAPFNVIALASSGLPVSFSITTQPASGVASINGNIITILGPGSVTVTALQAGNNNYLPASAQTSFNISAPLARDITMSSLIAPLGGCGLGSEANVVVKIRNAGTEAVSGFPLSYQVNGGTPVTETVTGSVASGADLTYTFTTPASFPNPAQLYELKVYSALAGDQRTDNDTLVRSITRPAVNGGSASSDTTICAGGTAVLKATGGSAYAWTDGPSTSVYLVSPVTTTSYEVSITDLNGCSVKKDTVRVFVNPLPRVSAGPDRTMLRGSSVVLQGAGDGSLLWSSGQTDSVITVSPSTTAQYILSATSAFGCKASDTVNVTVNFSALNVSPGLWNYGSVVKDSSVTKLITVTNTGTLPETVNGISGLDAPFFTTFIFPVSIPPGTSINIPVRFTPADLLLYQNVFILATSAGSFNITLQGQGVPLAPSWSVTPANYDFGRVQRGTTATKDFIIRNTGNIPLRIQSVTSPNPRFSATTNGQFDLPVGGSVTMVVRFNPVDIVTYSGFINIRSTTSSLGLMRALVAGTGYVDGAAPVLSFLAPSPYNGTGGVSPAVGPPGLFTYEVKYSSADSVAPRRGYPKVGIDRNNDGDFTDAGEGIFEMTKSSSGYRWRSGESYVYATSLPPGDLFGYKFIALDSLGNEAVLGGALYKSGPIVTREVLDLHIYASDIVFSNPRPNVGQQFTVTATIHNNSPYSASGVDVRFYYKDSLYLFRDTISFIEANSSVSITKPLSFSPDGFYPIKVWIDSARTLPEGNILNNYASRPVIVGTFTVPGAIVATANASPSVCNKGKTNFSGTAYYTGLNLDGNPPVEGATVTLKIYSPEEHVYTFNTTAKGEWFFRWDLCAEDPDPSGCEGPACGVPFTYSVQVTDFTLTSAPVQSTFTIPCATCTREGEIRHSGTVSGCIIEGAPHYYTANIVNFIYDDQNRKLCAPTVYRDTIEVYRNGELRYTHVLDSITTCTAVTFTDSFPGLPAGDYNLSFIHTYYTAAGTRMQATVSTPYTVLPAKPDLILLGITQTGHTSFSFVDRNTSCGVPAGRHMVYLYDSMPGDAGYLLIDSFLVNSVPAGYPGEVGLSYSNPDWQQGYHYLKIVTDVKNTIDEIREDNNVLYAMFYVQEPDIRLRRFTISNSALSAGQLVNFSINVYNTGSPVTIPFKLQFKVNGIPLGNKINVTSLNTGEEITLVSSPYTVPLNPCPIEITAYADVDRQVQEFNELNNADTTKVGINIKAGRSCNDEQDNEGAGFFNPEDPLGTFLCQPYVAPRGVLTYLATTVRNTGTRDASNIKVQFKFNGQVIGSDVIPVLRAGQKTNSGFYYAFDTVGKFIVNAFADHTREICELSETDNVGSIHVDSRTTLGDLQILSQYIAPSNLNPDPGQNVSVVASILNIGDAPVAPNMIRFWVDDVQLGLDVPIDTLYPGQDTTVLATQLYSSNIVGPKVIRVMADALEVQPERRENNNVATRAIIVGGAPDFANSLYEAITLSPAQFSLGDSVTICNYVRNFGGDGGSAWMRFYYTRLNGEKVLIDSVRFTMNQNDSFRVCKKWLVTEPAGLIITEIDHSDPPEFDTLNNADTLAFGTIIPLTLLDFNGRLNNRIVSLNWEVAHEQGLLHYEIQRSADGLAFAGIGQLAATNSPLSHTYTFDDSSFSVMPGPVTYYRLRIVEMDGTFRYSDVVAVRRTAGVNRISGYPNPVKHLYQVQIDAVERTRYTLLLLDAAGKQLLKNTVTVQPGQTRVPVNMSPYAKGMYWISMTREDGEVIRLRLVKE